MGGLFCPCAVKHNFAIWKAYALFHVWQHYALSGIRSTLKGFAQHGQASNEKNQSIQTGFFVGA